MNHTNSHRYSLFFAAMLFLVSSGTPLFGIEISYKVNSCTANTLNIDFETSPADTSCSEFFFAFTTLPKQSYKVNCIIKHSPVLQLEQLPVMIHDNGWYGTGYLQWCSFRVSNIVKKSLLSGSIQISFDSPLYAGINPRDITVFNGIFSAKLSAGLSKKTAIPLPDIPFTNGVRIEVSDDGMYEIPADSLAAMGIPIDRIESRFFRLFNQNREIPCSITDPYKKYLQRGDFIRFYGTHLRGTTTYYTQYSNTNVYWLTWGAIPGIRIAEVSGGRRKDPSKYSSTARLPALDFKDTVHFEFDNDIRFLGDITNQPQDELTDPPGIDTTDNWYWSYFGEEELTTYKITLPSPSSSGKARLRISFTGITSIEETDSDHQTSILFNNVPAGTNNKAVWDGQNGFVFESDPFSADQIITGPNEISFICQTRDYPDRIALNWIDVEYSRNFVSMDNRLTFKSNPDALGKVTEYQLTDFTSDSIELWDITNNRHFNDLLIVNQPNSGKTLKKYSITFQDSITNNTTYFASAKGIFLKPRLMMPDTIKNGWEQYANADYIIVSADSFKTGFEPLLKCHSQKGLKVAFAAVEDIYNRFSAGIRDPESIRTFLKYICSIGKHVPRYLLLGGDTTHDLDKKNGSRNIVPTHLSRIPGWGPAADDGYFSTVIGDDDFPDLIVGRFPAQNRAELKTLVDKTTNFINKPDRGFWKDNALLLGGGESVFTAFNSYAQSTIIGPKMNCTRLEADSGSQYYKDGFIASKLIADNVNAGVLFVNFNGHGGGNIWSDNNFFGYKDLSRLLNGQWGNGGRLPVIFSFTCLTGFFESESYRSLGEEFIRTDRNGAICFYGASAYTSQNGNIIMNKLMLENLFSGRFKTIGELIDYCELSMLVQYGTQYRHLIRQYNLLGDPALPFHLTPDTMKITLSDTTIDSTPVLNASVHTEPVYNGTIALTVKDGSELWEKKIDTLHKATYSSGFQIKKNAIISNGLIRVYAWNDSSEIRGWTSFSQNSLNIEDVSLSTKNPVFGDSVFIICTFHADTVVAPPELYCLYALAPENNANVSFTGIRMIKKAPATWISVTKVPLAFSGKLFDRLLVFFRILDNTGTRQSPVSVFPVNGLPDVTFTHNNPGIYWDNDSLRTSFEILNIGNEIAGQFRTHWFINEKGSITDTIAIIQTGEPLKPGKTQFFTFTLPDSQGTLNYQGILNYHNEIKELYTDNNSVTISARILIRKIKTTKDTLASPENGISVIPARTFAATRKLFFIEDTIEQKSPLQTPSQWSLLTNNKPVSFQLGSRPQLNPTDSLTILLQKVTSCSGSKLITMTFDSSISAWKYYATVKKSGNGMNYATVGRKGPFTFACVKDITPPDIMISVDGRTMHFLDYASKDKPFSIFISDPSGVNPSSISLLLNNRKLTSEEYSSIPQNGDLRNITLTAYPKTEQNTDSLEIIAEDLAGNRMSKVFTYKTGDGLNIKFLSCHPNPFTAKTLKDDSRQTIIFAFVLTDLADKVTLTIYTVSGKPIKSWSLSNSIGYQEIRWDGRDSNDYRIANGTYYAKLVAVKDKTKVKKIIRIAKLEGY